jgi:hypothetical protein
LGSDPEDCDDALKWWDDRRDRFPHLARMAIDYLAIPGKLPILCLIKLFD